MIIAVDFDGTCVSHHYPSIGKDVPYAVQVLKLLVQSGVRIILWTVRSGPHLKESEKWFADRDIPLWGVNVNPQQKSWSKSPKVYCDLFIDDAALGCPTTINAEGRPVVDWRSVGEYFRFTLEEE